MGVISSWCSLILASGLTMLHLFQVRGKVVRHNGPVNFLWNGPFLHSREFGCPVFRDFPRVEPRMSARNVRSSSRPGKRLISAASCPPFENREGWGSQVRFGFHTRPSEIGRLPVWRGFCGL